MALILDVQPRLGEAVCECGHVEGYHMTGKCWGQSCLVKTHETCFWFAQVDWLVYCIIPERM